MQVLAVIGMGALWWCLVNLLAAFRAHVQQRRWQSEIDEWTRDVR